MTDELLYEVNDHVAVVTFNRPERMNTITPKMLAALSERLLEADGDRDVRAIILTGAGRAWCAGLDIGALEPAEIALSILSELVATRRAENIKGIA